MGFLFFLRLMAEGGGTGLGEGNGRIEIKPVVVRRVAKVRSPVFSVCRLIRSRMISFERKFC